MDSEGNQHLHLPTGNYGVPDMMLHGQVVPIFCGKQITLRQWIAFISKY